VRGRCWSVHWWVSPNEASPLDAIIDLIRLATPARGEALDCGQYFTYHCQAHIAHHTLMADHHSVCASQVTPQGTQHYTLDPLDLGIPRCQVEDLKGGDAALNAQILRVWAKGSSNFSAFRTVAYNVASRSCGKLCFCALGKACYADANMASHTA